MTPETDIHSIRAYVQDHIADALDGAGNFRVAVDSLESAVETMRQLDDADGFRKEALDALIISYNELQRVAKSLQDHALTVFSLATNILRTDEAKQHGK